MKLKTLKGFAYNIPHAAFDRGRAGLLIRLQTNEEDVSWGDIAPLPGWSQESLQECILQLDALKKMLLKTVWEEENFKQALRTLNLFPSVAFGLEQAFSSLLMPHVSCTIPIPLNAFLSGSVEEIITGGRKRADEGYVCAKIKVGTLSISDTSRIVQELKPLLTLRLDFNKQWNLNKMRTFLKPFDETTFDYLEEPLSDLTDLPALFPYPIALDESIRIPSFDFISNIPHLKTLILKPTLQSDYEKWIHLAKEAGLNYVISSAYESGVGHLKLAQLAQASGRAHGLDFYRQIKKDLLQEPFQVKSGHLIAPSNYSICMDMLTEIL